MSPPPSSSSTVATASGPRPPPGPASSTRDPWLFTGLLLAVFLTLAGITAFHHEFWRDEMQAWLIGRDLTFAGVIHQARYEGAPPLWNLLLWALARICPHPELMQIATWLIAGATLLVICRWAPFNRLHKALLVGNYYLLFQYGTVCRNYLPGILALCLACVFALSPRPRPWMAALCLVAAGFTSAHCLLVAGALAVAFWGTPLLARLLPARLAKRAGLDREPDTARPLLPLALTLAGLLGAIACTLPAPDTYYPSASDWHFGWWTAHFARICAALIASAFPLPRPPGYFWIPPWDTPEPSYDNGLAMLAAGLLWFGSILLFLRSPKALVAYLAGTLGVGQFLYTKYLGSYRHVGFLFFTFFFACWILRSTTPGRREVGNSRPALAGLLLTAMLLVQAFTGLWAAREDVRLPFSGSKNAVAWLREHGYENAFIAVGWDWAGAPLAGYLNRTLYYPHDKRQGSYTRWIRSRDDNLTDLEFYRRAMKEAGDRPAVLILDHPLPEDFRAKHHVALLTYIAGSLAPFEEYAIHLAQPVAAADPVLAEAPPAARAR